MVAWLDLGSGHLEVARPELRRQVMEILAHRVPGQAERAVPAGRAPKDPPRASPPPPLPPLTDWDDLALHRPGALVRDKLTSEGPGLFQRLLESILRRPSEWDSWRKGLEGERKVGKELRRFAGHGWQVLHSVPLSSGHDIDHLLIGPGGVFTLNTKNFRGRRVWVGDDMVKVDHGKGRPYPMKARRESERASKALSVHCGFPVLVTPLLVFVRPAELKIEAVHGKVRVYNERTLAALAPISRVMDVRRIEQIYAVARHRQTWLDA
ncbi:NERD domain-containing protein [Streptomyces qinzhouensis]|uniref:NERD domain-containing protein n=2 Tax=Streptomyces qinzhouensis TaxID=2599401 RepID=A0A5B8JIA0_9ACTN|nr:NERD domain-containing protein [Streptomyces qinzhouensis]